jgi:hypothetical protein
MAMASGRESFCSFCFFIRGNVMIFSRLTQPSESMRDRRKASPTKFPATAETPNPLDYK